MNQFQSIRNHRYIRDLNNYELSVKTEDNRICFYQVENQDNSCRITVNRTSSTPNEQMGVVQIYRTQDYIDTVPEAWRSELDSCFLALEQGQDLILEFSTDPERPKAVKLAVNNRNVLNQKPWNRPLFAGDYIQIPRVKTQRIQVENISNQESVELKIMCVEPRKPDIRLPGKQYLHHKKFTPIENPTAKGLVSIRSDLTIPRTKPKSLYSEPNVRVWDQSCSSVITVKIVRPEVLSKIVGK